MIAIILCCLLAPLPAREAPPVVLRGVYTLDWGGTSYVCEIDRDGCWDCVSANGTKWIGGVEIDGRTVVLREAIYYPETGTTGPEATYRLTLNADLTGETTSGTRVRFERKLE